MLIKVWGRAQSQDLMRASSCTEYGQKSRHYSKDCLDCSIGTAEDRSGKIHLAYVERSKLLVEWCQACTVSSSIIFQQSRAPFKLLLWPVARLLKGAYMSGPAPIAGPGRKGPAIRSQPSRMSCASPEHIGSQVSSCVVAGGSPAIIILWPGMTSCPLGTSSSCML